MAKTATFSGRKYRVIAEELDGFSDTDNHYWIIVQRDLKKRVGLETAIHEALHCCNWSASEEKVESTARDVARFLWNLGYRHAVKRS